MQIVLHIDHAQTSFNRLSGPVSLLRWSDIIPLPLRGEPLVSRGSPCYALLVVLFVIEVFHFPQIWGTSRAPSAATPCRRSPSPNPRRVAPSGTTHPRFSRQLPGHFRTRAPLMPGGGRFLNPAPTGSFYRESS